MPEYSENDLKSDRQFIERTRKAHETGETLEILARAESDARLAMNRLQRATDEIERLQARLDEAKKVIGEALDKWVEGFISVEDPLSALIDYMEDFDHEPPNLTNVSVNCANCGADFVTASDSQGVCWNCGGPRKNDA